MVRLDNPTAPPGAVVDEDSRLASSRRVEDWVAQTLGEPAGARGPSGPDDWIDRIASASPVDRRTAAFAARRRSAPAGRQDRARLRCVEVRGRTVARVAAKSLVKDDDVHDLGEELACLIASGRTQVVVDFSGVGRVSSQLVPWLDEARSRCAAAEGGLLKLCGLGPEIADLLVASRGGSFVVAADAPSAVDGPWPAAAPPALPVAVLAELLRRESAATDDPSSVEPPSQPLRLVGRAGRWRGRSVAIGANGLTIGRDGSCALRTSDPTLSRSHAVIEIRDGRYLLRDLGSTNGTTHNESRLGRDPVELAEGDLVKFGALEFVVERRATCPPSVDDLIAEWSANAPPPIAPSADPEPATLSEADEADGTLRFESLEGVLVATPLVGQLVDEAEVNALRSGLIDRLELPGPRQVVVNLDHVGDLSGRAIGVLLAQHLRLDRDGGALRICQAHARTRAALDHARLPMLMGVYATLDEAVLDAWE